MSQLKKYLNTYKLVFLAVVAVSFFLWKPLLLFLLPGLLLGYLPISRKISFFEFCTYSVVFSLSFWICSFWLLKFLPLPLSLFIYFILGISVLLVAFGKSDTFALKPPLFSDLISLAYLILLLLLFMPLYYRQIVPSGADMATHSYIARLIFEQNGFPQSYEPILPVKQFDSPPFGFPLITASISILGNLPIYKSALILTSLTYVFMGLALLTFLRLYFSLFISLVASLSTLLLSREIFHYIIWGGNLTILSIGFLVFAISFVIKLLDTTKVPTLKYSALFSLILYASFTIHSLPLVNALYMAPFIFLYVISKKNLRKKYLPFLVLTLLLLIVFAIPFFSSLKSPSENTLQFIKNFHDRIWREKLLSAYSTIPKYLQRRIGENLFLIAALGLFASFFIKLRHKIWLYIFLLLAVLIIINARHWFLPLSPLLWPDRIVTISTIAIAYFTGCFIYICLNLFQKVIKIRPLATALFIILFITVPINDGSLGRLAFDNYKVIMAASEKLSSVSQDDLNAFIWISENTSIGDVFANNYGDAGIWIPAISFRMVVENDAGLDIYDEVQANKSKLNPSYLYLGGKIVYPMAITYLHKVIEKDNNYTLVYSSGRARVYKINQDELN